MSDRLVQRSNERRFKLKYVLGRGAYGEVMLAEMITSGGMELPVAVKLLHLDKTDEEERKRFRDEARLLAGLTHQNLPRVWDLATIGGRLAQITEFVDGGTLGQVGQLPRGALWDLGAQVGDALAFAWDENKIVHRDIKPDNIMVNRRGIPKVMDWGISRGSFKGREAATMTMKGAFFGGSPGYLAPERMDFREDIEANEHNLSRHPSGDVFSLGATLYKHVVGHVLIPWRKGGDPIRAQVRWAHGLGPRGSHQDPQTVVDQALANLAEEDREVLTPLLRVDVSERLPVHRLKEHFGTARSRAGGSLTDWARDAVWPEREINLGELGGREFTEGTLTFVPSVKQPLEAHSTHKLTGLDDASAPTSKPPRRALFALGLAGSLAATLVGALGVGVLAVVFWPASETDEPQPTLTPEHHPETEPDMPIPEAPPAEAVVPPPAPAPRRVAAPHSDRAPVTVVKLGTVRVDADVHVVLRDGEGVDHQPGELPVGSYDMFVSWPGTTPRKALTVTLKPGETQEIRCVTALQRCNHR